MRLVGTIAVSALGLGCILPEGSTMQLVPTNSLTAVPTTPSPVALSLARFPSGAPWSLSDERGHVVLLDVWATWCEPCRDALPTYQALQARFADRGLRVYAVNVDEDASLVAAFVDQLKVSLPVLRDPSARAIEQSLRLQLIPTSYVIDATGLVRHVHEGFADDAEATLAREVEALLAPR